MPWHCAHVILYVKFKDGKQDTYPGWENIYLINARDADEARKDAARIANGHEGDANHTLTWNGRPATLVFAGVRKVVSVSHVLLGDDLSSGDEVTYSEFSVPDEISLRRLANGESVSIDYVD